MNQSFTNIYQVWYLRRRSISLRSGYDIKSDLWTLTTSKGLLVDFQNPYYRTRSRPRNSKLHDLPFKFLGDRCKSADVFLNFLTVVSDQSQLWIRYKKLSNICCAQEIFPKKEWETLCNMRVLYTRIISLYLWLYQ